MRSRKLNLTNWLLKTALVVLLLMSFTPRSSAHIVAEEPWHPVAQAYLRAIFYANLKPVNWELIAGEYEKPIVESGYKSKTVYDLIAVIEKTDDTDHVESIRKAISDKDPKALYSSSTRALSHYIRYHLVQADSKIDKPGVALNDVLEAKRLYRALEDFIEQVDQEAYYQMGRSWLSLTSSVGSAG
ncbi:MAG: hypothetical protein KAI07_08220, partial [Deltaproteobacteria bacterium]|nr:hypothetical protein [Deltaproteobacteria bacterium]